MVELRQWRGWARNVRKREREVEEEESSALGGRTEELGHIYRERGERRDGRSVSRRSLMAFMELEWR
jgi:hypothetical protein